MYLFVYTKGFRMRNHVKFFFLWLAFSAFSFAKHDPGDNAGLKLPGGFSATMFADSVGKARHIAVTKSGAMYIKLSKLVNGKGILYVKDADGDGKVDQTKSFCNYIGTGI